MVVKVMMVLLHGSDFLEGVSCVAVCPRHVPAAIVRSSITCSPLINIRSDGKFTHCLNVKVTVVELYREVVLCFWCAACCCCTIQDIWRGSFRAPSSSVLFVCD